MSTVRGSAVALMTRAPVVGETKSRLAASIGTEAAAMAARAFLLDAADAVRGGDWHASLFGEPADATAALAELTGINDARPQDDGALGARMLAAVAALGSDGHGPVVVVGTDIPTLTSRHLAAAFDALRTADVVFGPAEDGGYYLAGMYRAHIELFDDTRISWGGADVLATSERLARNAGLTVARIAVERDIDTVDDLDWLRGQGARVPSHTASALRHVGLGSPSRAPSGTSS